jgi:hypothetical protein
MTERPNFLPWNTREPEDDLLDYVVYNVRDRTMEPSPNTSTSEIFKTEMPTLNIST